MKKLLLFFFLVFFYLGAFAAGTDTLSVRRVVKGDEVHYTYKLRENGRVYTKEVTLIRLTKDVDKIDKNKISLLVSKSHYTVYVLLNNQPIKSFRAVFGSGGHLQDKQQEGDKKTPEGTFRITSIRSHDKWHMFLALDYPTMDSRIKFEENKRKKRIPENARIGGSIGIHGVFDNQDNVINMKFNWTDGCISLKNSDLAELVKYLQIGTKVKIVK